MQTHLDLSLPDVLENEKNKEAREKGRDLTQSYDEIHYTHIKIHKATPQYKNATETSITHRFRTDLGRSFGLTTATQLVWLHRLRTQTLVPGLYFLGQYVRKDDQMIVTTDYLPHFPTFVHLWNRLQE